MSKNEKRLLLADNNPEYRRSLRSFLELHDYQVEVAGSVEQAKELLEATSLDLALIDLRLIDDMDDYDMSGLEIAKRAREKKVLCIFITSYPSVAAARIILSSRGAESLAEDLVPKADGPQAVLTAVEFVLSHQTGGTEEVHGDLEVDLERGLAWRGGKALKLSRQQYALLAYLYGKRGVVCSPEELLKAIYDEQVPPERASADRRLERLVDRLRQKIEEDPSSPRYLTTVHGRGFFLSMDR